MDWNSYNNLPDYWDHVLESNSHYHSPNNSNPIEPQRPICPNTLSAPNILSAYFPEKPSSNSLSFQPSYALPGSGLSTIHTWKSPSEFFPPSTNIYHQPSMADFTSQTNMMSAPLAFPHLVFDTSRILATPTASEPSTMNDRPKKLDEGISSFICEWKNCEKNGPFFSKGSLMRHIDTQHVAPRSYKCSDRSCRKTFNRKDNLEEHTHRVHSKCVATLFATNLVGPAARDPARNETGRVKYQVQS